MNKLLKTVPSEWNFKILQDPKEDDISSDLTEQRIKNFTIYEKKISFEYF